MKTNLFILAAIVVVLVCTGAAVVVSNDRKVQAKPITNPQVISLQTQLKKAQDTLKLHDAVNTTNLKNAADQFIADQKALCGFIIAHTPKGVVIPNECQ